MSLESQISQLDDSQEFVRLCNTVFTAKFGNDFQVIDGTRGDQGNDGYVNSEKRILAIYCPIKPEQRTDKDYLRKISSDLSKASSLKESGNYAIDNWTFVTPRKLSNNVIVEMRAIGAGYGIMANHVDATYLAIELTNYPTLIEEFPQLHLPQIDAKLTEILKALSRGDAAIGGMQDSKLSDGHVYGSIEESDGDFARVITLRESLPSSDLKAELRGFVYESTDKVVQINALIGVLELYDPLIDDFDDVITMCDLGIRIAVDNLDDPTIKAYFLAQKGFIVSYQYSELSSQVGGQIAMGNAVGIQLLSSQEFKKTGDRLKQLQREFSDAFSEALEIVQSRGDAKGLADILVFVGNAAGMRYIHENSFGYDTQASADKRICKTALLAAKDICSQLGYEWGLINTMFNLANQIRFFGEEQEALQLAVKVVDWAASNNDQILLAKANALKDTLETGVIPDYMAGETRDWQDYT